MDIEKTWKALSPETRGLPDQDKIMQALGRHDPQSPLKKMKWTLMFNMCWAAGIGAGYLIVICLFHHWQVQLCLAIALLFNCWGLVTGIGLYRNTDYGVTAGSLLTELRRNSKALKQWTRLQSRVAVCVYPFCVAGGFLLGGAVGSGKSVETLLGRPHAIVILIGTIILLTPLAYWLTKWMLKQSFGKVVAELDIHINRLSNI